MEKMFGSPIEIGETAGAVEMSPSSPVTVERRYRDVGHLDTTGFFIATREMVIAEAEDLARIGVVDDVKDDSWLILLQTLGLVSMIILVRLLVWELLAPNWRGHVTISDTSPIYTGLFFLLGAVFNAVNADFKEAEKLPMDMSNSFDQVEDAFWISHTNAAEKNGCHIQEARFLVLRGVRRAHLVLLNSDDAKAYREFLRSLRDMNMLAHEWERRGATNVTVITIALDKIRRSVSRCSVIARTENLVAMRAVLIYFVAIGTITMSITTFANEAAMSFVLAAVLVVFWFVIRVIHAVDDPFDQSIMTGWRRFVYGQMGCVTLYPLRDLITRMAEDLLSNPA